MDINIENVRYFDGNKPVSIKGKLKVSQEALEFYPDKCENSGEYESFSMTFKEIVSISVVEKNLQISLLPNLEGIEPIFEFDFDKDLYRNLVDCWSFHHKSVGLSIRQFFQRITVMQWTGFALFLIPVFIYFYFYILSISYNWIPTDWDEKLADNTEKLFMGKFNLCDSMDLNNFLQDGAKKLSSPDSPFSIRVKILQSNHINAFALPGGRVYFFSGLIENSNSPEEVLGVLSHEIAHIEKRHQVRQLIQAIGTVYLMSLYFGAGFEEFEVIELALELGSTLVVQKYSRDFELEADEMGTELLMQAKMDPRSLIYFLENLEKVENTMRNEMSSDELLTQGLEYLQTHPYSKSRVENLEKKLDILNSNSSLSYSKINLGANSNKKWDKLKLSCALP